VTDAHRAPRGSRCQSDRDRRAPADGLDQQRPARPDEIKRLGDHPVVVRLRIGSATVEVAAQDDASERLLGPYGDPVDAAVAAKPTPIGEP
jgi:hypothetical protein